MSTIACAVRILDAAAVLVYADRAWSAHYCTCMSVGRTAAFHALSRDLWRVIRRLARRRRHPQSVVHAAVALYVAAARGPTSRRRVGWWLYLLRSALEPLDTATWPPHKRTPRVGGPGRSDMTQQPAKPRTT